MNTDHKKDDPLFYRVKSDPGVKKSRRPDVLVEKRILKFSIYAALFWVILGLVWGVRIHSRMLIFDGFYSFASILMTGLSVYVASIMQIKRDAKFPFGRMQVEPMAMIFRSLVILVICAIAFSGAFKSLLSGGREINIFSAVIYWLIASIGCLACWVYTNRQLKKTQLSGLVKSESMQWFFDTLLSLTIFLGFLAAYLMQQTGHVKYVRYVDPFMVIISALFLSIIPVISIISGTRDILNMAPDGNIYRISRHVIGEIAKKYGFDGIVLRIVKSGKELIYEIGFVSDDPDDVRSMGKLDDIRQEVELQLKPIHDNPIWLDVSFMHDKKWG